MRFDGVILDIDGTLWDSREVVAEAWNEVIRRSGIMSPRLTKERLSGLFGKPMDEIARALFPECDEETRQDLSEKCYSYENELLAIKPGEAYPGVRDTLKELSKEQPLYIVSNCQCGYIEVCMKGCNIEPYITDHLCYGDTGLPKSETLRQLVERNHLKSPIYVGDTQGDADACAAAGLPIIYAAYGFGQIDAPFAVIKEFAELPGLLRSF